MTVLEDMKTLRETARGKLRNKSEQIKAVLMGGGTVDPILLSRREKNLKDAWDVFDKAHDNYMVKLNPDADRTKTELEYWSVEEAAAELVFSDIDEALKIDEVSVTEPDPGIAIQSIQQEMEVGKEVIQQKILNIGSAPPNRVSISGARLQEYRRMVDGCRSTLMEQIVPMYTRLLEYDVDQATHVENRKDYITETEARLDELKIQIADQEFGSSRRETTATADVSGENAGRGYPTYFQKSKFPEFGGAKRDYPGFRKEWRSLVSLNYDQIFQIREIRKHVPKDVEPDVKNASTMDEVWEILNNEYGQAEDVCGEAVEELRLMVPTGKSDSHKFVELYRKFSQVKNDLAEFKRLQDLDNLPVIKTITNKFPGVAIKSSYAAYKARIKRENSTATTFEILNNFMREEKGIQQDIIKMCGENDKKPADSKDGKDKCYRCGQFGHKKIDCTKDGSKSGVGRYTSKPSSRVNLLSSQPGKPCPVCKTHHSKTNNSGDTVYMSRLTSCSAWMNLSLADRAKAVETANGCSLCTDWTGDHQKDKCDAKKKGGIPYEACKIEDNSGRTCGSQHNHLLHGSSVQFCNLV